MPVLRVYLWCNGLKHRSQGGKCAPMKSNA
ncbi:uncharacterized protein An13g02010 [Aspergillus niger]|uniref:Contig An13c0060, genomic contig n=2 Tax=Aspergillus niger TaxID=5061 RepID=A2R1Q0_ASPNC|nr:uncharacterized protein An13g02010 [Aspergillus niger]CAK41600.1 unnamed protein product [Aspergillus niger]